MAHAAPNDVPTEAAGFPAETGAGASLDPRIRRTRAMLHRALERLLETTALEKISVGDIAEAATLNRATFYDHYPDKGALLEGMVRSRFGELMRQRGIRFDGSCPNVLRGIILATCDYLAGMPGLSYASHRGMDHFLESAMVAVVRDLLLEGIRAYPPGGAAPAEVLAATVAGAIHGGVNQWLRTPARPEAEAAVAAIFPLVLPMIARRATAD